MSTGVWTVLLIIASLIGFFVWAGRRGKGPLSDARSAVPGLKRYPTGEKHGNYSIKFYPDKEAIAVQSTQQGGNQTSEDLAYGFAKIVVFFTSFELFYYGNGSKSNDTSGPLRAEVRAVLNNPDEPTWEIVEWDLFRNPLFRYDGDLYENALTVPGILGIEPRAKDVSLVQGVKALIGRMVNLDPEIDPSRVGPQDRLVRHSITQLLDWHDEFGPAASIEEGQFRAAQAWQAALLSVRAEPV